MQDFSILRAIGSLLFVIGGILLFAYLTRRNLLSKAIGVRPFVPTEVRPLARLAGNRSIVSVTVEGARYHILLARDHSLLLQSFDAAADAEIESQAVGSSESHLIQNDGSSDAAALSGTGLDKALQVILKYGQTKFSALQHAVKNRLAQISAKTQAATPKPISSEALVDIDAILSAANAGTGADATRVDPLKIEKP